MIWESFAELCVLCGKTSCTTINRKERQERKVYAKSWNLGHYPEGALVLTPNLGVDYLLL